MTKKAGLKVPCTTKTRLAGTLGVGFMDHTHLMEDGAVVNLSTDDPLRENLEALQVYLDTTLANVVNGIRGTLLNIKALT